MMTALWARGLLRVAGRRVPTTISHRWLSSYPPHQVVGLPSLSPTMESGSIAAWNLAEGDSFGAGDVFCEVETDKATVSFESQDDGVLAKILVPAGPGEIKVGAPIMITVEDAGDVAAFADYKLQDVPAIASTPPPPAPAVETAAAPPPPARTAAPTPAAAPVAPSSSSSSSSSGERVFASPLAHMLAKELGYDITMIDGTGPDGRVIAADVKEFSPSAAAAASTDAPLSGEPAPAQTALMAPPVPGEGYTDYPLSAAAQEIAARLMQAKRNVPHYYLTVDIAVDELLATRAKLNASLGDEASLGVYELLIKAAAMSMKTVPSANASWMESVVRVYDSVDINVVVGSGDALYTPVIKDCASKGLRKISQELAAAMAALEPEREEAALGGVGTFTIMNLGMYGIKSCAPIIREPQSCALALGALENRIVPNDDAESDSIYKECVMVTATLSCDHRVVDGAVGAQWLAAFKSHVENPATLLL